MRLNPTFTLILLLLAATCSYAQPCDCARNFAWMKKTFEENDAGFRYAMDAKTPEAYAARNKATEAKVKDAHTMTACTAALNEWLRFFRTGHLGIVPGKQSASATSPSDWETFPGAAGFDKYLAGKSDSGYEGIWKVGTGVVGIKKERDDYTGFILESGNKTWTNGQVRLKFHVEGDRAKAVYYREGDRLPVESDYVAMVGKNHLQIGRFLFARASAGVRDEPEYAQYVRSCDAQQPYLEQLNPTTLYLRVPSFDMHYKQAIDSVLEAGRTQLLKTKNLVIDIRSNGGGSDEAYRSIMDYLYTNPVRAIGVEYYSTKLNNQRMLDFIDKPEWGIDEKGKKWAKESYAKLEAKPGQFVNLDGHVAEDERRDTVYAYPRNVAILINGANGSTAEQFLLEAKQSRKVKLFGVTTGGVLDISNLNPVESPDKNFTLYYALSRSLRIPDFTIDGKGIQPDYYLDRDIPRHAWATYASKIIDGE